MGDLPESTPAGVPLPLGFRTIEDIRNLPNEQIKAKVAVSIIGFVKDFMPPKKSRGTDWKCTMDILDLSDTSYGIKANVFNAEDKMPNISGAADAVLIRNIKVQMYSGAISLLTSFLTEFHVLASSNIPKSISAAPRLLWKSYPASKCKPPTPAETSYVIWANGQKDNLDLPSDTEFQEKRTQAMKSKDKFSLLKDVKPDKFYDVMGELVKVHESMNSVTIYLSDYTANSNFYHQTWGGGAGNTEGREGDEYGYTKARSKPAQAWPGPFGKLAIQITVYDEHAIFIREQVKVGAWVFLSNLQVKYGNMGGCLEGYLRGDRDTHDGKIQVRIMQTAEEPEGNDPRWKEGLRRKREYEKKHEAQKKDILVDDEGLGNKRKFEGEEEPKNSKARRKEKRAAVEKKVAEDEARAKEKANLNEHIKCAFPDIPSTSIKDILTPELIALADGSEVPSPFTNRKHRATVRVVDYAPRRIEDFAVWRRESEYDMLSDFSGGEDTDPEEELRSYRSGKGYTKKQWEWRFWLQVEDASPKSEKERMWVLVSNHAAQGLFMNLDEDAMNLRTNHELLAALKEQLFKLWGDLEEKKSAYLPPPSAPTPTSSFASTAMTSAQRPGAQPDADSDSESEDVIKTEVSASKSKEKSKAVGGDSTMTGTDTTMDLPQDGPDLSPSNKAFTCCLQQYGIKEPEENEGKADAGPGRRWQRVFGLFGTQIM